MDLMIADNLMGGVRIELYDFLRRLLKDPFGVVLVFGRLLFLGHLLRRKIEASIGEYRSADDGETQHSGHEQLLNGKCQRTVKSATQSCLPGHCLAASAGSRTIISS